MAFQYYLQLKWSGFKHFLDLNTQNQVAKVESVHDKEINTN